MTLIEPTVILDSGMHLYLRTVKMMGQVLGQGSTWEQVAEKYGLYDSPIGAWIKDTK